MGIQKNHFTEKVLLSTLGAQKNRLSETVFLLNVRKMTYIDPKLDLVNMTAFIKFGEISQFVLEIMSGNKILA